LRLNGRSLCGLLGCGELARRDDQREVAERLREVADLPPAPHVVLLGEKAEIMG